MVKNVPNYVIRPFENQTKKCLKSQMFQWLLYRQAHTAQKVLQLASKYQTSLCSNSCVQLQFFFNLVNQMAFLIQVQHSKLFHPVTQRNKTKDMQ